MDKPRCTNPMVFPQARTVPLRPQAAWFVSCFILGMPLPVQAQSLFCWAFGWALGSWVCPPPPPPPPGPLRVFVSSSTHSGDLNGLSGADATCQRLALSAGLTGKFKAWLSDSSGASPSTRFARGGNRQHRRPYVLVDGTEIASNWEALIGTGGTDAVDIDNGSHLRRIRLDETGAEIPRDDVYIWSSTSTDGTYTDSAPTCSDWTVSDNTGYGMSGHTSSGPPERVWTMGIRSACHLRDRLYCFEQDDEPI